MKCNNYAEHRINLYLGTPCKVGMICIMLGPRAPITSAAKPAGRVAVNTLPTAITDYTSSLVLWAGVIFGALC